LAAKGIVHQTTLPDEAACDIFITVLSCGSLRAETLRTKFQQREQVFDGDSYFYFYASTAKYFLSFLTGSSKSKPDDGISKWELDMVNNLPIQFPFGFGGPSQQRRTKISAKECLSH
jgi:hypothetical protein